MFGQNIKSSTGAIVVCMCVCVGACVFVLGALECKGKQTQLPTNTHSVTPTHTHCMGKCNAETKLTSQPTAASIFVRMCVFVCVCVCLYECVLTVLKAVYATHK